MDGYSISNTSFREEVKVDEIIKQRDERRNTERNNKSEKDKEMDGAVFMIKKAFSKRLSSMFEKPDA